MGPEHVPAPRVPAPPALRAECADGYKYRDQLIPQQFAWLTQAFFLLLTVMTAAGVLAKERPVLATGLVLLLGIAGFCALFAYVLDLQANSSCKAALRYAMIKLDDLYHESGNRLTYWDIIRFRWRYRLERWYAPPPPVQVGEPDPGQLPPAAQHRVDRSATPWFVSAAYLYLVVWVLLTVALVIFGVWLPLGKQG